ncbi:hypothetical protein BC936DRAFT_137567 [Jimgerdemannia flammicorona]|uniref:Uncharacterized protein n=1 Tax=Jimgerdemannia flammicorona TaxID=994334 RepID=A0A433CX25_9FUNG|nr:hypothetical protein BC936DRAFT_137567 [Jimgerdemannia flammicorona]
MLFISIAAIAITIRPSEAATATPTPSPLPPKHREAPQGPARLTGYPTWHGYRKGWDAQTIDAVTLWSVMGTFIGAYVSLRYGRLFTDNAHINKEQRSARLLTSVIAWYIILTSTTVLSFFIVDMGKLWSPFGALHNLMEVSILAALSYKGQAKCLKFLFTVQFIYVVFATTLCLVVPWPYDAILFKFQGLIIDFSLSAEYIRLYNANKRAEYRPHGARHGETAGLLSSTDHDENGHANEEPEQHEHPESVSVKILIVASFIHLFGNVIGTMSESFWCFTAFQYTYGLAYPVFSLFVYYQNTKSHQSLVYANTTWGTQIGIFTVSTILSAITTAVGVITAIKYNDSHPN